MRRLPPLKLQKLLQRHKLKVKRFVDKDCTGKVWSLFLCPEVQILAGYLLVVVVPADVFDALPFQVGNTFGMEHQFLQCLADTLVGWFDIDDRTELGLVDDLVVLGFAAADADDALRHGQ